jgi:hypothetical protein
VKPLSRLELGKFLRRSGLVHDGRRAADRGLEATP